MIFTAEALALPQAGLRRMPLYSQRGRWRTCLFTMMNASPSQASVAAPHYLIACHIIITVICSRSYVEAIRRHSRDIGSSSYGRIWFWDSKNGEPRRRRRWMSGLILSRPRRYIQRPMQIGAMERRYWDYDIFPAPLSEIERVMSCHIHDHLQVTILPPIFAVISILTTN